LLDIVFCVIVLWHDVFTVSTVGNLQIDWLLHSVIYVDFNCRHTFPKQTSGYHA